MRVAVLLMLLLALAPAAALARDGGDVRVRGTCGRGAASELRLKADHGAIRVEFRLDADRGRGWSVVLVHERRVVWRGHAQTRSGGGFRLRRSVPDFDGADRVTVRASTRRGNTCAATGVLTG